MSPIAIAVIAALNLVLIFLVLAAPVGPHRFGADHDGRYAFPATAFTVDLRRQEPSFCQVGQQRLDVFGMNDCQHEPHGCSLTLMPRRASVRM